MVTKRRVVLSDAASKNECTMKSESKQQQLFSRNTLFPLRLHAMLEAVEESGGGHIVSWLSGSKREKKFKCILFCLLSKLYLRVIERTLCSFFAWFFIGPVHALRIAD
ncbi:hypothetical protein IV203_003884 [Nitzschia inconspicua]|uniref:Uncharacterized protein n=1 Tax=Nitzschia inconspicua TaxID=303405 RepID=A0A9K3L460_9STRA|nr:hypothetical protein IV203_003884 [Nitzschia inconspicua]